MNEPQVPISITILLTIIGAISGTIGPFIVNALKSKRDSDEQTKDNELKRRISENEQAINLYREILANLREEIDELEKYKRALEEEKIKNREELVRLTIENTNLKEKKDLLCKKLLAYEKSIDCGEKDDTMS